MDLLTKLVSVQTMELLMLKDLAHKNAVVSDPVKTVPLTATVCVVAVGASI